jgi:hypothetical protein
MFISFLIKKEDIEVYLFPIENVLSITFKYIYCDMICTTFNYQIEEIKRLKKNWIYKDILHYPHTDLISLHPHFWIKGSREESYKYQFGFCSTSSWLRIENKLMTDHNEKTNSELKFYSFLKKHLKSNVNDKIIILLHPREKTNEEIFKKSISFYKTMLQSNKIYFSSINEESAKYFKDINILFSSSISMHIKSLFCGYKSIFPAFTYGKNFFVKSSSFNNTISYSQSDLNLKIDESLKLSRSQYIEDNNLHFYNYTRFYKNDIFETLKFKK